MSADASITLKISAAKITRFCDELCSGSSNISRKHASLIALEGFIIRHADSDTYSESFNRILSIIQGFSEQTRQELLATYQQQLRSALEQQQTNEITRIHQALSRNGFDQLLGESLGPLQPAAREALKTWAENWCSEAEATAQAASGYPDALNFSATPIALPEYQAMCELRRKLSPL